VLEHTGACGSWAKARAGSAAARADSFASALVRPEQSYDELPLVAV